jgi:hypothetical protein
MKDTEIGILWRVDADGGNAVQLASGNNLWPKVTLGDKFVLYADAASLRPRLLPLAGGDASPIADRSAWFADISPDGKRLAFMDFNTKNKAPNLVVCELPSCSSPQILRSLPMRAAIHWTSDSRAVAYAHPRAGDNIFIQSLDRSLPQQLTRFTDHATIGDFAWSHDGTRLAILRTTVANDIVLMRGLEPGR